MGRDPRVGTRAPGGKADAIDRSIPVDRLGRGIEPQPGPRLGPWGPAIPAGRTGDEPPSMNPGSSDIVAARPFRTISSRPVTPGAAAVERAGPGSTPPFAADPKSRPHANACVIRGVVCRCRFRGPSDGGKNRAARAPAGSPGRNERLLGRGDLLHPSTPRGAGGLGWGQPLQCAPGGSPARAAAGAQPAGPCSELARADPDARRRPGCAYPGVLRA